MEPPLGGSSGALGCALALSPPSASCSASAPLAAGAFETRAREALVVDHDTGMVLLAKDADTPMPPASMSKLMTLYMLFEAIRDGRVKLDTEFLVSPRAQAMGGSRMFVEAGTTVPVEALIHGIITQSGNDACVVVAEGLAGSEAVFAEQMTQRAHDLGMTELDLQERLGLARGGPRDERARPRHPVAATSSTTSRSTTPTSPRPSSPGTASPSRTATRS